MEKDKFDANKFRREEGLEPRSLQPYDYERYLAVNPKLTQRMYEHLRFNRCEWKILCGLEVHYRYTNLHLEEVWYLKCDERYMDSDFYKYRYVPEMYLALDTW